MIASAAKGFASKSKAVAARSMSTVRYAEYGHPLNVLKYVSIHPVLKQQQRCRWRCDRSTHMKGVDALTGRMDGKMSACVASRVYGCRC